MYLLGQLVTLNSFNKMRNSMFPKTETPPPSILSFSSCDNVNYKQELCFFFVFICQLVTWQS